MQTNLNRKAMGDFLKARRESLSPEQLGLPKGYTRRRTPGLRREEVAQLADLSTTWYTWLEQGRDVATSPDVLERLSTALQLTNAEREYLYLLAGRYSGAPLDLSEYNFSPAFLNLVTNTPYPFFVTGPENRLIAWNESACAIMTDFSLIPLEDRQMMRLFCMHPAFRTRIVNWEQSVKTALSFYRKVYDRSADQYWYTSLIENLKVQSKEFAEWWPLHEVAYRNGITMEIQHPSMGRLHFEIISFSPVNNLENLMCCIYMPIPGSQTSEKLAAWMKPT
ncbi:helix-turn-helix transcriptional regulator [Paenibacillus sp. LHD-117]|uniref:helix-turn-helix transcriptional regulator n=1 Tax=Paenibacillus sp. LHD-117 TaxID=3071412 RepID=UPI0027DF6F5F|nr:helix-turn-helix transcriptional regulator [Paenibacillus sp. LHD-117]MDQ6423090.1 helix-turn-helix transcriptional regulator [Paenibacillus sp. LHD-117]